jgi:hypothetical protein
MSAFYLRLLFTLTELLNLRGMFVNNAAVWLFAAGDYCDRLPVVSLYKAWVYGRSLAEIVG